jgi:hypothetical protein
MKNEIAGIGNSSQRALLAFPRSRGQFDYAT